MATYTPNFNLSKPDLSDPFGDFRQSYNDNMDTIDTNLGSGGGSSTLGGLDDVDIQTPTDGQALVYDANTQEWINTYISGGGGGSITHEVIHQTNVGIYDNTQIILNLQNDYIAPVVFAVNALPLSQWGGIIVVQAPTVVYDSANDTLTFNVYTNTGQTYGYVDWVVMDKASSGGGSGSGIDYSTTERKVGKWIDGNDLYSRVFTNVSVPYDSFTSSIDLGVEADTVVSVEVVGDNDISGDYYCTSQLDTKVVKNYGQNTLIYPTTHLTGRAMTSANVCVLYTKVGAMGLPYIYSSGIQYINTGIAGNTVYGVKFEFAPINIVSGYQSYLSGELDDFTIGQIDDINTAYIRWRGNEIARPRNLITSDKNTILIQNNSLKVNGTEIATPTTSNPVTDNSANIYIFNNPNLDRGSAMRFYGLQLYDSNNDTLINLIPYRDLNGVACLYDMVSRTAFYNDGSGVFEAGTI